MQPLILTSYPKLNIFLKILGKRIDGFHILSSRFVLAKGKLFDTIVIESNATRFSIEGNFSCHLESNTIYKAKCALEEILRYKKISIPLDSLKVSVQKHIPEGAGLGGGSSNAAMFIKGVQELYDIVLTAQDYAFIAKWSGADVAFFLSGYESANVSGIGECVESFSEKLPTFDIYTPHIFCPTPEVYKAYARAIESKRRVYSTESNALLKHTSTEILSNADRESLNDLYLSALEIAPELESISKELGNEWFFSGSGSSFFRQCDV